jgi:hypothetical protein
VGRLQGPRCFGQVIVVTFASLILPLRHDITRQFFIGVCDIRDAPISLDEASLTVTLVTGDRQGVDSWHEYLHSKGSTAINITAMPHHSAPDNCYAFNFYDTDLESLGNYRFEVQTFEDPLWPKPPPAAALVPSASPVAPQQVTWFYTKDLNASTHFIEAVLGFPLVLDQGHCTIHSHPQGIFLCLKVDKALGNSVE